MLGQLDSPVKPFTSNLRVLESFPLSVNFMPQPENADLAPYAVPHVGGLGRMHRSVEKPGDRRTRFSIDHGRIIHSEAFRRLEKTQVYPHGASRDYETATRWSHTIEVAYHAECNAKAIGLNEELARVLGLAHDLGHTPFGHEGEDAMVSWMKRHGLPFEHNQQTVRIVSLLMHHKNAYRGLNLNVETIEGLAKHTTYFDKGERQGRWPSLEAQVVDRTDTISWIARDIHDGINLGVLQPKELQRFSLYERAELAAEEADQSEVRSELIHLLCSDLISHSQEILQASGIQSVDDVYQTEKPFVTHSPALQQEVDELVKYLMANMYRPPSKDVFINAVREVIHTLCDYYLDHPNVDVEKYEGLALEHGDEQPHIMAVKDYVSGLTDKQAYENAAEGPKVTPEILKNTVTMFKDSFQNNNARTCSL